MIRPTGYIRGKDSLEFHEWAAENFDRAQANAAYVLEIPLGFAAKTMNLVVPELAAQFLYDTGSEDEALSTLRKYSWENGVHWKEDEAINFFENGYVRKPKKLRTNVPGMYNAMDIYAMSNGEAEHPMDFLAKSTKINGCNNQGFYFNAPMVVQYASISYPQGLRDLLQQINVVPTGPRRGTFIYLIEEENTRAVKIGYSDRPRDRLESLQSATPNKLTLLDANKGSVKDETLLHAACAAFNIRGEWFTEEAKEMYFHYFDTQRTSTEF